MTEFKSSWKPEEQEYTAFLIATIALTIAFTAYKYTTNLYTIFTIFIIAAAAIVTREIGQRIIAQWMDMYVELETSEEGLSTTLLGALIAGITGIGFLFLFPIESKYSGHKYEQWGKSVDAMWAKRQYWLASSGIIALIIVSALLSLLNFELAAQLMILFAFFQILPLDYSKIPTGTLDGAYILRWSGFVWTGLMGLILILIALI